MSSPDASRALEYLSIATPNCYASGDPKEMVLSAIVEGGQ